MEEQIQNQIDWKKEVLDFLKTLIIFGVLYFVIKTYIAQPFIVRGSSMESTFQDGNYLIVDELTYRLRDPERYEVIIFHSDFIEQSASRPYYIKRIIALPGERITINEGIVMLYNADTPQGTVLTEEYLESGTKTKIPAPIDITLGEDEYFVMGDNRGNSSDSRYWGPLERKYIVGKPFVRLYPFTKLTLYTAQVFGTLNQ